MTSLSAIHSIFVSDKITGITNFKALLPSALVLKKNFRRLKTEKRKRNYS